MIIMIMVAVVVIHDRRRTTTRFAQGIVTRMGRDAPRGSGLKA
jgi:hypothetical protein